MKKVLILIFALTLMTSGCSSILISDNIDLSVEHESTALTANVNDLSNEQPGRVCALTDDKKYILSIGRANEMYTIDQFDIQTSTLVNITTSDTRILDVQAAKYGFFYTKVNASSTNSIQIVWSSSDRLIQRTITDTIDSPGEAIYVFGDDRIVYINNSTELVFADSNGVKKRYDLDGITLVASKIIWIPEKEIGFLIAQEPDANNYILYRLALENDEISINPIDKNVLDMDVDDLNARITYAVQDGNNVQVYLIEGGELKEPSRIYTCDTLNNLSFNNNSTAIYYSKPLENGVRSTIWIHLLDENKNIQLSSPLRLNSSILAPTQDTNIYFSANQLSYISDSELTQPVSYITKLEYELEN